MQCKTHNIHPALNMPVWDRHVDYIALFFDQTVSLWMKCVWLLYLLNLFVPQRTHRNTIYTVCKEVCIHRQKHTPHTHTHAVMRHFQHEDHRMIKLSSPVSPSTVLYVLPTSFKNHCLFIVFIFSIMNGQAFCWYPTSWWLTDLFKYISSIKKHNQSLLLGVVIFKCL